MKPEEETGVLRNFPSTEEHAIAVAEEAVFLLDRVRVCGQHALAAGEGADQHEETGLGQMEVGEEGADEAEVEAGRDEYFRLAGMGLQFASSGLKGTVLQSSYNRGAYGNDPTAFAHGSIDRFSRGR